MSYFKKWPKKIKNMRPDPRTDPNRLSDSEWKNWQLFSVTGYHPNMDKEVENVIPFKDEKVDCPF